MSSKLWRTPCARGRRGFRSCVFSLWATKNYYCNPETIIPVKVSRSATEADFQELQSRIIDRNASNTLTIISSFVSQGERRILNLAIEARVPAVFLVQFDISDHSKIPAELLPAINEGRPLHGLLFATKRASFATNVCSLTELQKSLRHADTPYNNKYRRDLQESRLYR